MCILLSPTWSSHRFVAHRAISGIAHKPWRSNLVPINFKTKNGPKYALNVPSRLTLGEVKTYLNIPPTANLEIYMEERHMDGMRKKLQLESIFTDIESITIGSIQKMSPQNYISIQVVP